MADRSACQETEKGIIDMGRLLEQASIMFWLTVADNPSILAEKEMTKISEAPCVEVSALKVCRHTQDTTVMSHPTIS